ncbi:MAG: CRISPR-associated exonuclease Cas4 [uncultured Campylobacterales bacterium]|uniref:CRISPR-associated exonuclease Cas4 n=1 Tax=uncultured Campylobacterales bacterium TaxID=352960 RepID=A0A6S6TKT1_9BACT|nr:MAG: CRISPR-associated exonuclease Cas4 [uncultured Campylobacterales bacterium]
MIPINLIRQYKFCPRIVYYNLLTNIKPIYPRQVKLGLDYHTLQNEMIKARKFKKLKIEFNQILNEKYIENSELNICGTVDLAFLCEDEIIPVEFKDIESKPSYSHILQLVGYGITLEKKYKKPFKIAFIIHSNNMKFFKIQITEKHKNDFFNILKNINQIIKNDILPKSDANEAKCLQCEYLNYCDDRF